MALLDCLFYWGVVTFADSITDYHLLPEHEILHTVLFLDGTVIIARVHNHNLCKGDAFERIKKEVEEKPRKMFRLMCLEK